jgi:GR25 family glycosyltransferase involved in LPS biosynthesis
VTALDAKKTRYISNNLETSENDSFENIPVEIVTTHWDSTLNSKFDKQCAVNSATPLTPSERACAVGHVMVWKLIYDLSVEQTFQETVAGGIFRKIPQIVLNSSRSSMEKISKEEFHRLSRVYSSNQWSHHQHKGVNNNKYYLIFEDDFEIKTWLTVDHRNANKYCGFMARVDEIQRNLPSDTDICYLGYVKPYEVTWKQYGNKFLEPTYLWQLHAYLLSPSGARKLLASLPVNSPVDNFIARLIYEGKLKV